MFVMCNEIGLGLAILIERHLTEVCVTEAMKDDVAILNDLS